MSSRRTQGLSRFGAAGATAIVLEDIRSQNKVLLEALQGIGQKVDRLALRMEGFGEKLERFPPELLERLTRLEERKPV